MSPRKTSRRSAKLPPAKKRAAKDRYATKADIAKIHRMLAEVHRMLAEVDRIFAQRKEWLEELEHTCSIQFARIAQIQAELDEVRRNSRGGPQAS